MKIQPASHETKTGIEILIREANISDSKSIIECVKSYLKSNTIPLTPEEFYPTKEENEQWISRFLNSKHDLLLVAEYNGQIIGNIDLTIHHRRMLKHTAYLGMGIHEDYQNQGIGTILLEKALEWCDSQPEIEIIWLQVFGNNVRGINIYSKYGFIEEGRQKDFIKAQNGEYIDNVIMTRRRGR